MKYNFTDQDLDDIAEYPHKLAHLAGKNLITELHDTWIKYIWDDNEHRSLQAHRGSYKTTGIVIIGAIRWLLFNPNDRIAIVRKKFDHATECVETISKVMKKPIIKALFKFAYDGLDVKAVTDRNDRVTFNFKTIDTPEGSVDAYGINSEMTGKHYDKIICDDFVTVDDRISRAEREKSKLRIAEIKTNIIDPGKYCGFIGTPWHREDAWEILPDPLKFDCYSTKLLSNEQIEKKRSDKSMTIQMFAANYELKHISAEDQMFKEATFLNWNFHYKQKVYGHIDAKYSGNHTNGLCFMTLKADGRIQAIGFCFHEHVNDKLNFIYEKYKKYFCSAFFCEDNADKGFLAEKLRALGMNVDTYHESMNKHVKIENYGYKYWNNIDWDSESDPEYISQILDYQENQQPDDAIDNCSSLIKLKFDKPTINWDRWRW